MPPNRDPDTPPQETVRLSYDSPHVAVITLEHPPMNALTWESRRAFATMLEQLQADTDVRCLVLTGAGAVFSAGADLREEAAMAPAEHDAFVESFRRVLLGLDRFRAPVIAAINGHCVGGGLELALACDIRLASAQATFIAAGVNVGLIASAGVLPRIIGEGPAKQMLLSGQRIDAQKADQWGLVTAVHEPAALVPAALALAERIASRPPLSVEATKDLVRQARDLSEDAARRLQEQLLLDLLHTVDHKEAVRAFVEKRPGNFERR